MMGGDLVTFRLMGGVLHQHGCNRKPCSPTMFNANQYTQFFYAKVLQKGFIFEFIFCMAVQHHD